MKKMHILLILSCVICSSCFKTEDPPPITFDGEANMTIKDFQKLHKLSSTNPITLIDTAVIITGIVTSTDQFGSCYKEIYFQDSTGGLCIRIANTSYHSKYRIGQRIFVKAKDLYLGNYVSGSRYGFYQLGLFGNNNGGMEYISGKKETMHIFRSGVPEPAPTPKIIEKVGDIDDIDTGTGRDYHTLVKLVNCSFTDANGTLKYFEKSGTSNTISRAIKFNNGEDSTIEARISAFCSFANDILPTGTLTIEGILTMFYPGFNTNHQLIIRSINDVKFPKVIQSFDMKTDIFSLGWTNKQVKGEREWVYDAENKNVKIQMLSEIETECWLVSPKLNLAGEKNMSLVFKYRLLNGSGGNAKVLYTVNGTDWKTLDFIPQSGNSEAMLKLDDNMATNPNLQIAFQYKTTERFPSWYIMDIAFIENPN